MRTTPQIYLAGPAVFHTSALETFSEMKRLCALVGLEGMAPLDNQIGLENEPVSRETSLKIVQADLDLIKKSDGAIFCLDAFRRGTEMDAGTAMELGYAAALDKKMSGWTSDIREYPEIVEGFFTTRSLTLTETHANATGGTSGTKRDVDGMLVHSEGFYQNGMTQGAIELSGGQVFANENWKKAFFDAAKNISAQFGIAYAPVPLQEIISPPTP